MSSVPGEEIPFFFLTWKSSFHTETMYERIEEIQWCKVLMSEKSPASCDLVNSELGLWIDFLLTFFFLWDSLDFKL